MAQKNPKTDIVQEMEAPTGIDLNPKPPRVKRVSRRGLMIGLSISCVLGLLLVWGIYGRRAMADGTLFKSEKEKNVVPATKAAAEITKDIPAGIVNLTAENDKKPVTDPTQPAQSTSQNGPTPPPAVQVVRPAYPQYQAQLQREPTAEESRLIAAYERELRAIAAPTGIQSANPQGSFPAVLSNGPSAPTLPYTQVLPARTGEPQLPPSPAPDDQSMQGRKEAFLAKYRAVVPDDYLKSMRTMPLSQYEIKAGWEIPAVLEQDLNSDLPGDLKALVTANVYDTATGRYLLIPQGSRLIGTYDSSIVYGQDGLQAVWNRIIFPDASSIDLGGMIGQDAHGASGLRQDVDNHYKRLVGFSVLSSVFSAAFQLSQSRRGSILQNPSVAEVAASSVGQSVSQVGAEITRKNLNIQPTIKVPVGYKFNVRVNRDILFDSPYQSALSAVTRK